MQKTAYEMRISDWSSDVCSSDLDDGRYRAAERQVRAVRTGVPGRNGQDPRHAYRRPAVAAGQALTRRDPAMPPRGDRRRIVRALRTCSRSEEHTSELQSLMRISYAVFCLKKKTTNINTHTNKFNMNS